MPDLLKFGSPSLDEYELDGIRSVLDTGIFVHGSMVQGFEAKFKKHFGYPNAVSVANCTAGLHIAHKILFQKYAKSAEQNEVICPAMSHVATANAIVLAGLKPVFVDANAIDGNICVEAVKEAIGPRTVGIAVVHFNGAPADLITIQKLCLKHELYLVEDCAIALGAKIGSTPVGLFGDAGVFSFHPVKQMTTGEGGMVVCKSGDLAEHFRLQRAFGVSKIHSDRQTPGNYDVLEIGFNYRMAEIPAAIGIAQLAKVDNFLKCRKQNFSKFRELLESLDFATLHFPNISDERSYYTAIVLVDDLERKQRDELIRKLLHLGVETSVYYPRPIPEFSAFKTPSSIQSGQFPNSAQIAEKTIAFSISPHLGNNDLELTIKALKSAYNG